MAVAALTAVAFALRLAGLDQTIYGDERLLYEIVEGKRLAGVLDTVRATEKTPPLHFVLAWGAGQIGDPTISTRLPSLILGTATVPLVYLLGVRTVGRSAGFVAAAILALAPFSMFYGIENRCYATLTFFSALSTLALLNALNRDRPLAWLGYGASTAAVLYTHYTGVFVLLAQLGWAAWTHRRLAVRLVLVQAGVVLAFVPWLASFLEQHANSSSEAARLATRWPLSVETVVEMFTHALPGYPFVPLRELPGGLVVGAVWGAIGLALAAAVVRLWQGRRAGHMASPAPTSVLVVLLAAATPIGLILYSAQPDTSFLLSRNLSASVPALALAVGLLFTSLPRPFALAGAGVVLAGLAIGAAKTLDADVRRPPYRQVAQYVDAQARPGDAVLNLPITTLARSALDPAYDLGIFFERNHEVSSPLAGADVWARAAKGRSVFIVTPWEHGHLDPLSPGGYVLREERIFPGTLKLAVGRYSGELRGALLGGTGRRVIRWSLGEEVRVVAGAANGFLETVSTGAAPKTTFSGWAIDAQRGRPAPWVLVFNGRRLLAAGRPAERRVDVARAQGKAAMLSGFKVEATSAQSDAPPVAEVRAFAVVGNRASELSLTGPAKGLAFSR